MLELGTFTWRINDRSHPRDAGLGKTAGG
jgi:hypothetical protein